MGERYVVQDCDRQIPSLTSQLEIIRQATFGTNEDGLERGTGDARTAVCACRSQTLEGLVIVSSGLIPRSHADLVDHPVRYFQFTFISGFYQFEICCLRK